MACSDCNTSDTCRGEHGTYDDARMPQTISDSNNACNDTYYSDFEFVHTVNPFHSSSESYDEIEGSYKSYFLNTWFSEVPDSLIWSACSPESDPAYDTYADSVEYVIRQHSDFTSAQFKFDDPRPDDSGNYTNWVMDTALSIAPVVSSHPLVAIGGAAVKSYMSSPMWGDPVTLDQGAYSSDTDRDQWWWDIDMKQDMPTAGCDTTSVRFDITPGVNSLSNAQCYTWARYNVYIAQHSSSACSCKDYGHYLHTTEWLQREFTFDING